MQGRRRFPLDDEDDIFLLNMLKDPLEDTEAVTPDSPDVGRPEQRSSATNRSKRNKKRKRRDEDQNQPPKRRFVEPEVENEDWTKLGNYFDEEVEGPALSTDREDEQSSSAEETQGSAQTEGQQAETRSVPTTQEAQDDADEPTASSLPLHALGGGASTEHKQRVQQPQRLGLVGESAAPNVLTSSVGVGAAPIVQSSAFGVGAAPNVQASAAGVGAAPYAQAPAVNAGARPSAQTPAEDVSAPRYGQPVGRLLKLRGRDEHPNVPNLIVQQAHIECQQCGKHFGSELAVERHTLRVHKTEGTFQCRHCPLKLKSELNRKKHEKTQHDCDGRQRIECDVEGCTAFFNKPINLTSHKKQFHGALFRDRTEENKGNERSVYACHFCEYTTRARANLNRHVFSKHGAGREMRAAHSVACRGCSRTFVHSTNFVIHQCNRSRHGKRRQ